MSNVFNKLEASFNLYQQSMESFQKHLKRGENVTGAVAKRIEADKVRLHSRATDLASLMVDEEATEADEQVAYLELMALATTKHGPTAEEQALFQTELNAATDTLEDMELLRKEFRSRLSEVQELIGSMQDVIEGDENRGLRLMLLSESKERFEKL